MGVRYELDFENIEKVVDCKDLNENIQNLMVFLKLNDNFNNWSEKKLKKNIFIWACCLLTDGEMDSYDNSLNDLDEELVNALEKQIDVIVKNVEQALTDFKTKTDIMVYWDFDYEDERVVFELNWNDIVQFTSKVTVLDNMGVDFELTYDND
jgi:glutaredoxin-related protein